MGIFRLTKLAESDLGSIGRYTQATWGREQRNLYLTRLDACFHLLAREPERGHSCDDLRAGYRNYHIGRHLVFYHPTEEGIEIVRILHDRMDVKTHLDDG